MVKKSASYKKGFFTVIAEKAAKIIGSPYAFVIAAAAVIIWAISGPFFDYSDTWQLIINTSTTIITFLTVFLIQNTQNRDTEALHIKLDELLRATKGAKRKLMDLEELSEAELDEIRDQYEELARKARKKEDAAEKAKKKPT